MYFLFSSSFCFCTLHQNSVGSQSETQAGVPQMWSNLLLQMQQSCHHHVRSTFAWGFCLPRDCSQKNSHILLHVSTDII